MAKDQIGKHIQINSKIVNIKINENRANSSLNNYGTEVKAPIDPNF